MIIGINASFLRKPMTGIGQVTTNFLRELATFPNQTSDFILYCQEEPKLDFELPKNVQIKVFLPWWRRDDTLRQWWWERQLANEAVHDGCEVFLSLYQSATIFQSKSVRHSMLVHDLIPRLFPEYLNKWASRLHYRAIERAMSTASYLFTPSQTTKEDLVRLLDIAPEKITAIPLGVTPSFWARPSDDEMKYRLSSYGLAPGYFYHGGGLEVRKNTELVLRAYRLLLDAVGEKSLPELVISGKVHAVTNPLATPVQQLITELKLEDKVKLVGLVPEPDLPLLYQGAKLFLFPSRYEGFGLPVLEAMAAGTPVVTTNAGSLKELATNETAVVIPQGVISSESLKDAWRNLIEHEDQLVVLRERGQRAAQSYTWKQFAERVMSYLVQ